MSRAKQHKSLARRLLSLRQRRAGIETVPDSLLNKLGRTGYTYILRGYSGLCKIGTSIKPKQRINELRRMNPGPLDLIALINGGREMESELHRSFANCRCHGEWFRLTDTDLKTIRAYGESFAHIDRSDWKRSAKLGQEIDDAEWEAFKLNGSAPLAGSLLPDLIDVPALRKIDVQVRRAQARATRAKEKKVKSRIKIPLTQPRRRALAVELEAAS